jgi:S-layer protein (TIGR01567 family)
MKIGTIWFMAAVAVLFSVLCLATGAFAQDAVEAAYVRGHFSDGDGVWRAGDFGWFYYDPDEDRGSEELIVDVQGRTVEKGHITYTSKTWTSEFEYMPWGSFQEIGILGKPYLAGYPDSQFTDRISSLGKGELRRVLIDEDRTQTLSNNRTLALQRGYVLVAAEVSEKEGTTKFVLLKNGEIVYASVVGIGDTFVYKINDLPVILVHLTDAIKSGMEGTAEVDGIFQISDAPDLRLFEGALIGNMKLNSYSEENIEFQSNISISLNRDSEVPLTHNLKLVVLDQPDLIYYPVGAIFDYGVHEIRGPVFGSDPSVTVRLGDYSSPAIARWNSLNYSGFFFDAEQSLGNETLVFYSVKDRLLEPPTNYIVYEENKTFIQKGLQYTCLVQPKEFEYKPWGDYFIISFLGSPWFVGYDSSLQGNKSSKNLIEQEYLGRVLLDTELQGIILAGNYSLEEGYEMRIRDVGNDSLFLQLFKEGSMVDSSVVKPPTTYIYEKDLENLKDMPIVMMRFGSVFNNTTSGFAYLDAIFQISENTFPVEDGTGFGELEIVRVAPEGMVMVNPDGIILNSNSDFSIGPGMYIHVADNDTLRYYLYHSIYVVPPPEPPLIDAQDNVSSLASANFSIIVQAAEIRQVMVNILDSSNRTVFSRDISQIGQGSVDLWGYAWKWNATTMQLSDDKSLLLDAGGPVPGLLYLNSSSSPEQVSVIFDAEGRIAAIFKSGSILYISRGEYSKLNNSLDYGSMLANSTAKDQFIKIEPGKSILQFIDVVDGRLIPSQINHTLEGTLEALEPHAIVVGAKPGRYELRVRVENAVNAIQAFGEFFNVTAPEMRGVYLGSAQAIAGEEVSVPLQAPKSGGEKRINLTYDAVRTKAAGIFGECKPSWQVDEEQGRIAILLPAGCNAANITFSVDRKSTVNDTIHLNVTGTSGFKPETITNATITVTDSHEGTPESHALGFVAALAALAAVAHTRRRL